MDEDHPRSRGVYLSRPRGWGKSPGSSPLARGLRRPGGWALCPPRIIPARAGFTLHHHGIYSASRDHPRSRGVYRIREFEVHIALGSSPLARGLHDSRAVPPFYEGIIPARAGFTLRLPFFRAYRRDHPRSRGVYWTGVVGASVSCGSSPLARGLPLGGDPAPVVVRIIPARAGFTVQVYAQHFCEWDHPRSRGVYECQAILTTRDFGSSPLARGLLALGTCLFSTPRIIPARAGFTGRRIMPPCQPKDHPRSRGVYKCMLSLKSPDLGSSPLARGLL